MNSVDTRNTAAVDDAVIIIITITIVVIVIVVIVWDGIGIAGTSVVVTGGIENVIAV